MSEERTWLLAPRASINSSIPEATTTSTRSHEPHRPLSSGYVSSARSRSVSTGTEPGRPNERRSGRRRSSGTAGDGGHPGGRCRATASCRQRASLVRWRRDGPRAWLVCFAVFCAYSVCTTRASIYKITH